MRLRLVLVGEGGRKALDEGRAKETFPGSVGFLPIAGLVRTLDIRTFHYCLGEDHRLHRAEEIRHPAEWSLGEGGTA